MPAVELFNGTKYWYVHGEPHRENGPAVMFSDGKIGWWLYGIEYNEADFNNYLEKKNLNQALQNSLVEKSMVIKVKI